MSAGTATHSSTIDCTHAEADDRMMFHVQDILSQRSEPTTITAFIRQHRCICMPIIPFHSQLERSWPPRALARS